ncbi:MAG: hypothetical protein HY738_23705, partial [Bacteroidia bacterium]|nr:hypothetical protein [Bacteroidia bacterium]
DPTCGTAYTGNAAYGSGTAVGGGYAVYVGTGTFVDLTALTDATNYYFAIYEFDTGEYYNLNELAGGPVLTGTPKSLSSITYNQASTSNVLVSSVDNEILRLDFLVAGQTGTLNLNSIVVTSNNQADADIQASGVKLYRTTTTTFSTSNPLGTAQSFSGGTATFSSLAYDLPTGTTYIWVSYNIASDATSGNYVDAKIAANGIDVAGTTYPSAEQSPAGTRIIVYELTIGTGTVTTNNNGPFYNYYKNNRTQMLYTSTELGSLKTLTHLAFNISYVTTDANKRDFDNFTIKLKHTLTTSFGAAYEDMSAWAITVFTNADYNMPAATGWSTWDITDFDYNGTDNLIVEVIWGDNGEYSSTAAEAYNVYRTDYTADGNYLVTYGNNDAETPPLYDGRNYIRPNIKFTYTLPPDMTYLSSTTTQNNTSSVNAGTYKQEVVGIQIVTSGVLNPLSVTSFSFNTAGTTNATNDVSAAQLWSTGTNAAFATTTQIGSTVSNPDGAFSFSPSVVLFTGTNYFWLTYDVKATAPGGDVIDAQCNSVTVGSAQTPTEQNPSGNRPIIAATDMQYVSSTTTQNSSRATRPDINAHIIGVQIVTNGALSAFSATSFSFNTTGTSAVVTDNIQNAKLWFTGLTASFTATTQVGSTVAAPDGAFTITPSVAEGTLYNGTNYFWLTYDIKATAACDPAQADAQCTSITLTGDAGSARTPSTTAPPGARVIDCLTPYYSKGSLAANLLTSWSSTRDGTGASPGSFDVAYKFYVQNGHSMTTGAADTIPYLTIEAGGYITATYLITMTDLRINSFGTFEQVYKATSGTYITNFYIENDGTWVHNNEGYLPSVNRYFSPLSNQWFYKWGGGTFPSGTAWGNLLLNGTTTGNFGMGSVLTNIQGNFEWRRIGNNNYLYDEANETITIGGNLIFSG